MKQYETYKLRKNPSESPFRQAECKILLEAAMHQNSRYVSKTDIIHRYMNTCEWIHQISTMHTRTQNNQGRKTNYNFSKYYPIWVSMYTRWG